MYLYIKIYNITFVSEYIMFLCTITDIIILFLVYNTKKYINKQFITTNGVLCYFKKQR